MAKKDKLDCPILHLEKVFDTQGQECMKLNPVSLQTYPWAL